MHSFENQWPTELLTRGISWNNDQFSFNTWPEAGLGEDPTSTKTVPAERDFAIAGPHFGWNTYWYYSVMSIDDTFNYDNVHDARTVWF